MLVLDGAVGPCAQTVGICILARSIEEPLRQIIENAGEDATGYGECARGFMPRAHASGLHSKSSAMARGFSSLRHRWIAT
jgi:chaperonin GroEL (HSP60 family)